MSDPEPTAPESGGADLAAEKAVARTAAFARRKAAKAAAPDAPSVAAARFLDDVPLAPGAVVSGYRPIRTELDPTPLMIALIARGCRLCVPVIDAAGRPLSFRAWTPETAMVPGPFGAEVPADGPWLDPELLITPLAAFDRGGGRLGYGGGFYDRTLAKLRAAHPTWAVGYAYAAQEADRLPLEPTDMRLDAIVTERETIRPNGG